MAKQNKTKRNRSGQLDILKYSVLSGTSSWKTYNFEILGNVYFIQHNSKKHNKPKDIVVLSEISKLERSMEDSRVFTVCFTGLRRSWTLRASSKGEKGKWMEALVPGSCHPEDREDVPLPTPEVVSSAPPLTTPAVQHGVVNPPPYPEAQFYPQLPTNYH